MMLFACFMRLMCYMRSICCILDGCFVVFCMGGVFACSELNEAVENCQVAQGVIFVIDCCICSCILAFFDFFSLNMFTPHIIHRLLELWRVLR